MSLESPKWLSEHFHFWLKVLESRKQGSLQRWIGQKTVWWGGGGREAKSGKVWILEEEQCHCTVMFGVKKKKKSVCSWQWEGKQKLGREIFFTEQWHVINVAGIIEFVNCLCTGTRTITTQSRVPTRPRTTDGLDRSPVTGRPHAYTGGERAVTASCRDTLSVPIGANSYILDWPWLPRWLKGSAC